MHATAPSVPVRAGEEHGSGDRQRLGLLAAAMAIGFLVVAGALVWLQIGRCAHYRRQQDRQKLRLLAQPPARGRILARDGTCLAGNRPCYCLAVDLAVVRRPGAPSRTVAAVEELLGRVTAVVATPVQVSRDKIASHLQQYPSLPFVAWRDLNQVAVARWAERQDQLPGVYLWVEPVRRYPYGKLAAHVLGYVARERIGTERSRVGDLSLPQWVLPGVSGRSGVEKLCDPQLAGAPGVELLVVEAAGYERSRLTWIEATPGEDVRLTLDLSIQELAEEALCGETGAVVVLDANTGEVLAMASTPGFDPNDMALGLTPAEWRVLTTDRRWRLFNRAIAGLYPPASSFKPIVALAALRRDSRATAFTCYCDGDLLVGKRSRFVCWRHSGHGWVGLRQAIEGSCNLFFYQMALQCGREPILEMAVAFGLGSATGIELPGELSGSVPATAPTHGRDDASAWRPGDTCNLAIGQGDLTVTPLQMARVAAAIANGGRLVQPRLLLHPGHRLEPAPVLDLALGSLARVRAGMYAVVQGERGTGRLAAVDGVHIGGKTGTGEFGPRGRKKKCTWMIAFVPFDQPRYAIAMVIEDGVTGGVTVAPRLREIAAGLCGADAVAAARLAAAPTGGHP